jgi:tetratricopeptide (TPR) repeat protein
MKPANQEALDLRQLGVDAMWQGRFDDAISLYDQALAVAESDETRELITIAKAEALIAAERDGAEIAALPAIVMRRRSPKHVFLAAYTLMRRFHETDRRRGMFYGEIARDAALELGEPFSRAKVLNTIGIIQTVESKFGEAIDSFDMALAALAQVSGRESEVGFSRSGMMANLGGAKVLAGQVDDGVRLLEKVIGSLTDDYSHTEALLDLCFGYIEQEKYDEAEIVGARALQRASIGRQIRNANHLLGEIMVRTNRYEEADRYFTVVAEFYPEYANVKELLFTVDLCAVVNWKG